MGAIRIKVEGSFKPNTEESFSAMEFGHAAAVAKAIQWLSGEVLPKAIKLDHDLHEDGDEPEKGFGER